MELIVGALVVLGFLAIATRFITRDSSGRIRLPRIVDDSIGMWVLRRITGRGLWERPWYDDLPTTRLDDPEPDTSEATRAALDAIAAANAAERGVGPEPGFGPAQLRPTRYVESRRQALTRPFEAPPPPVTPIYVPDVRRRDQARRRGLFGFVPHLAALIPLAAVLAVAVSAVGIVVLQSPRGAVLDVTGSPPGAASQIAVVPSGSPSPPASASPAGPVKTAAPTATPQATSRPTVRPTARPTPVPTPRPTPVPTPRPTPKPTAKPTPTPPPPPVASITCTLVVLQISCDGSNSARAVSYTFTFGDGAVVSGTDPTVSHLYLDISAASNSVTLTVRDSLNRSSTDTWTPA